MYSERTDWADVVPVPQYDSAVVAPIAPIFYSPECESCLLVCVCAWMEGGADGIGVDVDVRDGQTRTRPTTSGVS